MRWLPATTLLVLSVACGDSGSGNHQVGGGADASAGDRDAAGDGDAAPSTALVFDNTGDVFDWSYFCDCIDGGDDGRYLDLTRAANDQDGAPSRASIDFFKVDPSVGNITAGGFWFRSWHDPDNPGAGASFAIGEPFVIPGDQVDVHVKPPRVLAAGDTVGPDDDWLSGDPMYNGPAGSQEAHFTDLSGETGPDQIWFMDGIVGVRFTADDGTHYAFVELAFVPGQFNEWQSVYRLVRWGYEPTADTPLVIPP
jgi:hypothetical protein